MGGHLVVAQAEDLADEERLVGVDDLPVAGPELHADQGPVQHLADDVAHACDGGRVAPHQRVGHRRLDHGLRPYQGGRPGVGDGLPLTDAAAGDRSGDADHRHCEETQKTELQDRPDHHPAERPLPFGLHGHGAGHMATSSGLRRPGG